MKQASKRIEAAAAETSKHEGIDAPKRGRWRRAGRWTVLVGAAITSAACGGTVRTPDESGSASSTSSSSGALEQDNDTCSAASTFGIAPPSCVPAAPEGNADAVDDGLKALGTTRCSLGFADAALATSMFDAVRQTGGADYRALHAHPLALPSYGKSWRSALTRAASSASPVTQAIALAANRRGDDVDVCLSNWTASDDDAAPLVTALGELGASASDAAAAGSMPLDVQKALAPIVHALAEANHAVAAVRAAQSAWVHPFATLPTWIVGVRHFDLTTDSVAALGAVDVASIERAAIRLSATLEAAHLDRFAGRDVPSLNIATPMGAVIVNGSGADHYGPEADGALLVLDTGGDDSYQAAVGASSEASPVSIAIDLGGNDTYGYREVPVASDAVGQRLPSDGAGRTSDGRSESSTFRQGAGVFGIGYLFDLGDGDDTYRSLVGSQGVGALGVGVLYDAGGSDSYTAEGMAQGAAELGVGILIDAAGDDHAHLYNSGQGFGFAGGVGVLLDVAGNDDYYANPGDPSLGGDRLYGSDQLPGAPTTTIAGNMSMAQGVGAGHRPDWPDAGYAFPGGIGVLADLGGDDSYRAGVWGQGTGFVAGVGLLLDAAGTDQYDALYYAQGAGAHMGVGLLEDVAGDDRYDARFPAVNAMLGLGEDFSVGVHVDRGGDDRYVSGDSSLGSGNANGIGVAVNIGGGDSIDVRGTLTLGAASKADDASRADIPTYGLFVKATGSAIYETHADGDTWGSVVGAGDDLPALRGFGEDRETEGTSF